MALAAQRPHVPVGVLATEGERLPVVNVDQGRREIPAAQSAPRGTRSVDQPAKPLGAAVAACNKGLQGSAASDTWAGFVGPVVRLAAPSVGWGLGAVDTAHVHPLRSVAWQS